MVQSLKEQLERIIEEIFEEEDAKPFKQIAEIPLENLKNRYKKIVETIQKVSGIPLHPKRKSLEDERYYLVGVSKTLTPFIFWTKRKNQIFKNPTAILKELYNEKGINTKSTKGWDQTQAYVEVSQGTFDWVAMSEIFPQCYRTKEAIQSIKEIEKQLDKNLKIGSVKKSSKNFSSFEEEDDEEANSTTEDLSLEQPETQSISSDIEVNMSTSICENVVKILASGDNGLIKKLEGFLSAIAPDSETPKSQPTKKRSNASSETKTSKAPAAKKPRKSKAEKVVVDAESSSKKKKELKPKKSPNKVTFNPVTDVIVKSKEEDNDESNEDEETETKPTGSKVVVVTGGEDDEETSPASSKDEEESKDEDAEGIFE